MTRGSHVAATWRWTRVLWEPTHPPTTHHPPGCFWEVPGVFGKFRVFWGRSPGVRKFPGCFGKFPGRLGKFRVFLGSPGCFWEVPGVLGKFPGRFGNSSRRDMADGLHKWYEPITDSHVADGRESKERNVCAPSMMTMTIEGSYKIDHHHHHHGSSPDLPRRPGGNGPLA